MGQHLLTRIVWACAQCIVDLAGAVKCWGLRTTGRLGDGMTSPPTSSVPDVGVTLPA